MPTASCIYSSAGPKPYCKEPRRCSDRHETISNNPFLILESDAPATRVKNNEEVKRQRIAKRMKVEIARELGEKKAAEKTIKRMFFRKLYDSEYCMKGDPKVVARKLKQLKSESAKRDALKKISTYALRDSAGLIFTSP
jgi:hypothetical protein